jgi:NitT/TauT family transport system permease protein
MKRQLSVALKSLIVLGCLIALWEAIVWLNHLPPYMLPGPRLVLESFIARFPSLAESVWITSEEALGGLVASIVAGIAAALVFAQWKWIRQLVYPYTILLQTVPILAIAPLIINWIGPGISAVTTVAFIICLAPIIANTTQGLVSVDESLVNLFTMHKATPLQVLFKLRFPNALPSIFTGIRISTGISIIGAITGELFAGSTRVGEGGLGYAILYAYSQMETSYMFALVVAASVLGFILFFVVVSIEWLMLHNWHESTAVSQSE